MKTRAMIVAVLLMSGASFGQRLNYKMHYGDMYVYQEQYTKDISILDLGWVWPDTATRMGDEIDRARIGVYVHTIHPNFREYSGGDYHDVITYGIDSSGMVYQTKGYMLYGALELYPLYIPDTDTLMLVNDQGGLGPDVTYNYRAFDTVIYETSVHAISFLRVRLDTVTEVTVLDIFGLVRARSQYTDWQISSAVIGGVSYNRDKRKFSAYPTCARSLFQYETTELDNPSGPGSYITEYRLGDTLINGETYYHPSNMLWNYSGHAPYRVEDGLVYINENGSERMLDSAVSLGSQIVDGLVVDTGTVLYAGKMRRYAISGEYVGSHSTWVEGIGLTHVFHHPIFDWKYDIDLVYANICGEEFGEYVGIPELPEQPSPRLFSSPYPNPVSLGQGSVTLTATQQLTQPVDITMSDILGRKIYTLRLEPTGPGTALRIPLRNIGPGLYYLTLNGATFRETTKLVVVK